MKAPSKLVASLGLIFLLFVLLSLTMNSKQVTAYDLAKELNYTPAKATVTDIYKANFYDANGILTTIAVEERSTTIAKYHYYRFNTNGTFYEFTNKTKALINGKIASPQIDWSAEIASLNPPSVWISAKFSIANKDLEKMRDEINQLTIIDLDTRQTAGLGKDQNEQAKL